MPITFRSKHSPSVLMLERVALELIRLMGHSGTVPGSLGPEDVPAALARLEQAVSRAPDRPLEADRRTPDRGEEEDGEREAPVSTAHRALPLIELLKRAAEEGDYVIWDR